VARHSRLFVDGFFRIVSGLFLRRRPAMLPSELSFAKEFYLRCGEKILFIDALKA